MSEDPLMRKKAAMYPMNKKYGGLRPGTPTQSRGPRRYFDSGDFFKEQEQLSQHHRSPAGTGEASATASSSNTHGSALATTVQDCALMSPPDSPLSRSSASPLASGTASPLVGAANAEHISEHASSSNSSIATTGTPATPLKARTTQQAEQPGAAALPIILLKRSKSSVQVAEENGSSSATVTFDAEPQVLPSAVALLKAAQPAPDTTADADVQLRRSQRSQTVCGEQPDAATAGYNPAQFQAITSIEDIRNILMPRRSRLGEDVATPSPLATSCRLPRCERTHERRRSQHRKSLSSAEDYSKTRGSGSEGTPSRDEPAAAAGEHRHHSRHAHPQQ